MLVHTLISLSLSLFASQHEYLRPAGRRPHTVGERRVSAAAKRCNRPLRRHEADSVIAGEAESVYYNMDLVNGKNGREKGEDVADDDACLRKIRVALELVQVEGRRHARIARYRARL